MSTDYPTSRRGPNPPAKTGFRAFSDGIDAPISAARLVALSPEGYRDVVVDADGQLVVVGDLGGGGGSSGGLTDAQLRASAVPVSVVALPLPAGAATDAGLAALAALLGGVLDVSGPLTDAELRASALSVSGPLTDAQLRAAAVPVSGPLTDAQLRASALPVSGPLTDAQLRASALPVSGPLTDAQLRASALPVSGPLTDAQLRASSLPVRSAIDTSVQPVLLSWEEMAGTANVESALTNATFRTENLVALGNGSSYTVPAGKRLRITNVTCYVKATSTVNNLARFRIRAVASGSVSNSSPVVFDAVQSLVSPGTVAANVMAREPYVIPEGSLDFGAGAQLTFTWLTAANTCTVGMAIVGYLYTP